MSNLRPQRIRFPSSDDSGEISGEEGAILYAATAAAVAAIAGDPLANESEEDSDHDDFHDAEQQMPRRRGRGILDSDSSDASPAGGAHSGGGDDLVDTSSNRSNAQGQSEEDESLATENAPAPPVGHAAPEMAPAPPGEDAPSPEMRPVPPVVEVPVVAAPVPPVAAAAGPVPPVAAAGIAALGGMTPAEVQAQNRIYEKKFPNWAMSLKDCPALSHVQTDFDDDSIYLGSCTMRRPRQKELAKLFAKVLTAEVVAGVLAAGILSAGLAQDIGALLMKFKHPVPYNLVGAGLPDPKKPVNPKEPPKPPTEVLRLLGIMVSNVDAALHFKQWYEKGSGDAEFEQDLLQPLLSQYSLYLKENPGLRGLPLGRATFRHGNSPKPGKSCKRKRRNTALEYPKTSIADEKPEPDSGDDGSETHAGEVRGGAYVFAVNED